MQLELKIATTEEFLTLLEAVRGPAPVVLSEAVIDSGSAVISEELLDILGQELVTVQTQLGELQKEFRVQRGALEETINQLRELQPRREADVPKKNNGKTPMVRGIYCRFCGKDLDTKKSQKIFCSQACAGRWQAQHKGMTPTPRYTLKDEKIGTTVVAGVGVRD